MIQFAYDDGGRADAGFRGQTRDCVTRAIAIATGLPYQQVYDELARRMRESARYQRKLAKRYGNRASAHSTPRTGVPRYVYQPYLRELGWEWVPTMGIGTGCQVHLAASELPAGRLIVSLSRHVATVIDGTLHDTHDCSRDGTRCVYGFFQRVAPGSQ